MSRIRSLELVFNLEKKNFKSKEDCIVAAFHCLLINENLECVGTGDEWTSVGPSTELLPSDWNISEDVYSLRYISKDQKSRVLLKVTKMEHMLQVDAVMNEDVVANMSLKAANYISDDYTEYSSAYKDLESLSESFRKNVIEKLKSKKQKSPTPASKSDNRDSIKSSTPPRPQARPQPDLRRERDPFSSPRYPRVGGSDLDPFGFGGGGGMLMDPSSFGIPSRPTLPQFGVGGPGGLPRGAVPPGARFDPFMPPIRPGRIQPDPDHFQPPDFEDFM